MGKVRINSTDNKRDDSLTGQAKAFYKDSYRFMEKWQKPNKEGKISLKLKILDNKRFDKKSRHIWLVNIEYLKILSACCIGFVVMGLIGYFIKLVFIPINNIILGTSGSTGAS